MVWVSIYIVFSVFFLIQTVAADDKSAAEKTLKSKLNATIAVLQEKDADLQVKKTDEKIIYESPIQIKKKIQIQTYLFSKDEKTSILYKLYKHRNEWKIYDIEIEGVSIIRSYRAQFYHILKTETVDDLLVKLEKSVNS